MKFLYRVKTLAGTEQTGEIEAGSKQVAAEALRKKNVFIVSLKETAAKPAWIPQIFGRISLKDKAIFTRQLAVMVGSGFSIPAALSALEEQITSRVFRKVIRDIREQVEGGLTFAAALSKHPQIFPEIYTKIIASGEKSGNLEKILNRLAKDTEKSYDITAKIRGALYYPAFILLVLIGVVIIVLVYVMPQLETLFKDVDASLPLTTRALIGLSSSVLHFWWLILLIFIVAIFGIRFWSRTEQGRLWLDKSKLKIPVFGQLLHKIYLARFARTFSTLTAAGLPILDSFKILAESINNAVYQKEITAAASRIENGQTISVALKKSTQFPPMVTQLISVGEQSGKLDYVLRNLANFLEKEVDNTTKNLSSLLEPVLMVIMGIGVAFVAAAVIMPIYGLVQVIK